MEQKNSSLDINLVNLVWNKKLGDKKVKKGEKRVKFIGQKIAFLGH